MSTSAKLDEIREQAKARHQELVALENRADIFDAAEKLRTEPPHYHLVYDAAERFSDAHREAVQEEEEFHAQRITRRIRELYFAVQNIELRKELIAKDREEGDLALSYCQQELTEAGARLATARSTQNHWWVWTSLVGIALLALGFYFFGLIGALGGALVGSLNGRRMEQEALRARDAAVASAEQELKEAEQFWNKARNEPQTFSRREANTGEPDPQVHLRAV